MHGGNNNQNVQAGGTIPGAGGIASLNGLAKSRCHGIARVHGRPRVPAIPRLPTTMSRRALADATGGHAFYSTNDVTAALGEATDIGGNYYSLSYSPTNPKDDGGRRAVAVRVVQPGYKLSYRRFYFTSALRPADTIRRDSARPRSAPAAGVRGERRAPAQHEARRAHGPRSSLLRAHPRRRHPSQRDSRADVQFAAQPGYVSAHHKDKALAPIDLQKY